jgi:hypothetical protein
MAGARYVSSDVIIRELTVSGLKALVSKRKPLTGAE